MMGIGSALLWLANSKVGRIAVAASGIAVAIGIAVLKVFSAGKQAERAKQDNLSLENLRERAKGNDEIHTLDGDALKRRLNRWVSNDNER